MGPTQGATRITLPRLISAGGVVLRIGGSNGLEVVLCGRHRDTAWFLPKGTPRDGESLSATATREVAEETGLDVRVISPIGAIEYRLRDGDRWREKTVLFFLMEATGGNVARHDHEYNQVRWVPLDDAETMLSFDNYRDILRKAVIEFKRAHALRLRTATRARPERTT